MNLKEQFAKQLIIYRKDSNFSQEKLAELANIHRTYISQIERGLKSPTLEVIFSLCSALSIKPSEFIKGIENGLSN
ncbi:MAG: helix-turn-helix domain-containing protein [Spirochaetaceae bacterium]|jgi:transcriptional regulator with XRE-family HTH domain|nr:helix-turn-helix domain-containing protein [Spirochaetaceae bacterium]